MKILSIFKIILYIFPTVKPKSCIFDFCLCLAPYIQYCIISYCLLNLNNPKFQCFFLLSSLPWPKPPFYLGDCSYSTLISRLLHHWSPEWACSQHSNLNIRVKVLSHSISLLKTLQWVQVFLKVKLSVFLQ